jgi:hypothetical protein
MIEHTPNVRPIQGYEDRYYITDDGRLFSSYWGRINELKPRPLKGYLCLYLYRDGIRKRRYVHQLVMETFVGPRPAGMETCHNNGIKNDNRLANLRYDTHSANLEDMRGHGTMLLGERAHSAKLTATDALDVHRRYLSGESQKAIADSISVRLALVNNIVRGKTWTHVTGIASRRKHKTQTIEQSRIREVA